MKIIHCEQKTKEWHAARNARVTSTHLDEVMGTNLARVQLIARLIGEEMTASAEPEESWISPAMERGNVEEPEACKAFEALSGKKIHNVGFCVSDKYDWFGYSPDGLVEDYTEGIEIKNPNTATKYFYRLTNEIGMEELGLGTWSKITKTNLVSEFTPSAKAPFLGIPADYKWQVVAGFMINEKQKKLHFLVYDSRIVDPAHRLYVIVVNRENELLQEAMKEADEALVKFRSDWMKWREIIINK